MVNPNEKFLPLRLPGMGGWNAFLDPTGIGDDQLADVQNMVYDQGFLSIREGSELLYEKPESESGDPLQLIIAKTSDGIEYTIAVYANHFYVRHEANEEWVRINQSYVPTETDLFYGFTNWMNGRGDDRLYLCNGVDDMIRWDIAVDQANGAQSSGAASLIIDDATRFPATGTLVIMGALGAFTEPYTSHTATTFTLTGTLSDNVPDGASVAMDMIDKSSMEIGKHISKHQRRLIVANYYGGETVVFGSVQGSPEDFTVAATIAGAFTQTIADGNGEITALHDFGKFLVIEKEDSIHSLRFQIAADLGTKLTIVEPLVSGDSLGPLDVGATARVLNKLYYPTRTNGFVSISPTTSGDSVSVEPNIVSDEISPYMDVIELGFSRVGTNDNKIFWSIAAVGAEQNTIVLVLDVLRKKWTKYTGWAVKDFATKDGEVLYLDSSNGGVFKVENGTYNDNNNEYTSSAAFKRLDFGEVGRPKAQPYIFVQGYMTTASEFYFDVFFNEEGNLRKQTYRINKDTEGLSFSSAITDEMGAFVLGEPILGMVRLHGIANLKVFRCYLAIDVRKSFFNIQVRAYGSRAAFWGITAMAMDPEITPVVPKSFLVNPILEV